MAIPYFISRETSSGGRTLPIHQGGDDADDVGRVDRLSKKHVVSGGASLANPESLGEKRHGDRGDIVARRPRPHPPDELQTVLAGQPEVSDDDVDLGGAQDLPGLGRGAGGDHRGAERLEGGDQKLNRVAVVVDHQRGDVPEDGSIG